MIRHPVLQAAFILPFTCTMALADVQGHYRKLIR
jgi:hypothetical protein